MYEIKIVISANPVTKKNSSQILKNPKTGRYFIAPSKKYKMYEKECAWYLNRYSNLHISRPVNVKCLFYMQTRRRVDLNNLLESATDVLVKYGVLADDNSNIVVSHDGSRVLYDKDNARTEIYITNVKEKENEGI